MSTPAVDEYSIEDDDEITDPKSLARRRVRSCATLINASGVQLFEAVSAAREAGVTWSELAEDLGVSRQAVSARFGER